MKAVFWRVVFLVPPAFTIAAAWVAPKMETHDSLLATGAILGCTVLWQYFMGNLE